MIENLTLERMKPLTTQQYDACRETALKRIAARIGSKPERRAFERDYARFWGILDVLAGIIFIAALAVSSLHILTWTGLESDRIFEASNVAGWTVDKTTFGHVHQAGLIAMSEASILLFTVMFRLTKNRVRWILLALAIGAVVFVFSANLASGITPFVAILVPLFTVGISIRLEWLLVESMKRRREVDEKYRAALSLYETASQDATQHPHYAAMLKQELWQRLTGLKANQAFVDAPADFKNAAVARELQRDSWAFEGSTPVPQSAAYSPSSIITQEGNAVAENPLEMETMEAPVIVTNGNGKGH